jgi:putative transposase
MASRSARRTFPSARLRVMNEVKNCGVGEVLIAVVDGLKGFPEPINAVFSQTIVQK